MRISDWSSDVCSSDLFNLLAGQQLAVAFEYGHTVGLQQSRNPTGKVLNDLVLARDHGRNVHGHFASADAMNLEALVGFMKLVGAVQQRLGRNATYEIGRASCRERVCQYV